MQLDNNHAKHVRKIHCTVLDTSIQFWGARVKEHSDDESDEDNEDLPLYVPEDGA
jgi:hypothetical protein